MKIKLNISVSPKLLPVIGKKMRTKYFDVVSCYGNEAFADFPMIGVDRNQTNAYCSKTRLSTGRLGPSSDTSHACPGDLPLRRYRNI
jgi:hypothetical protein